MRCLRILILFCVMMLFVACGGDGETAVSTPSTQTGETDAPSGSLFYILQEPRRQALMRYDFATDDSQLMFEVPTNAWLSHMAASPDGSQLALTYAPSPGENEIQFGFSNLYLLLADGRSEPRLLLERTVDQEVFFNPTWSPDGEQIYYSHVTPQNEETFIFAITLEVVNVATGEVTVLAENSIWPRLSADGRSLAYVHIIDDSLAAELILADSDGGNPTVLVTRDQFETVDTPFFWVDAATGEEWLYFSAVSRQSSSATWWEKLLGIEVAAAHTLPSHWWRLLLTRGGSTPSLPERVTSEERVGQYGALSPDGRTVAITAQTGIFLMEPDGSNLRHLLDVSAADSLSWTPNE